MVLNITMTVLSIFLMGGTIFFKWRGTHEVLGILLIVLWGVHVWLNHRWYFSIFKGTYSAYRVIQTFINCSILICAVLLMISGIMLSTEVFAFLKISKGISFAMATHLVASHWYFIFMCAHLGLHIDMIVNQIAAKKQISAEQVPTEETKSPIKDIILRALLVIWCLYGLYAFIIRGVGKYLFLLQEFFFLDTSKSRALFVFDYISIIVLIATLIHFIANLLKRMSKN